MMTTSVTDLASPLTANCRPELSLLIACGGLTLSAEKRQYMTALLSTDLDWGYLLKAAVKHRMIPLLYQTLHSVCPEAIPMQVDAYLNRHCQVNTLKNLFLDHKLQEILAWYQAQAIPAIAYKGPELAKLAYGSLSLRQFTDLDVLVRPEDFDAAQALLLQHGFKVVGHLGWEVHFSSHDRQVSVDLHRALVPDFFGLPDNCIDPANGTLSPEDLLLLLAIQLGKDCCHWKVCMGQICDIAAVLKQSPNLEFDTVVKKAQAIGCVRFLWISLILVHEFLREPLPEQIRVQLCNKSEEHVLARWVIQNIQADTDDPEIVPEDAGFWYFFRVYNHRFYLQVRERLRDKFFYCIYWFWALARMSLRPNQADRTWVSLPAYLDFLYVPIHITRLLLKYGKK